MKQSDVALQHDISIQISNGLLQTPNGNHTQSHKGLLVEVGEYLLHELEREDGSDAGPLKGGDGE